jgi:hypothetical protein
MLGGCARDGRIAAALVPVDCERPPSQIQHVSAQSPPRAEAGSKEGLQQGEHGGTKVRMAASYEVVAIDCGRVLCPSGQRPLAWSRADLLPRRDLTQSRLECVLGTVRIVSNCTQIDVGMGAGGGCGCRWPSRMFSHRVFVFGFCSCRADESVPPNMLRIGRSPRASPSLLRWAEAVLAPPAPPPLQLRAFRSLARPAGVLCTHARPTQLSSPLQSTTALALPSCTAVTNHASRRSLFGFGKPERVTLHERRLVPSVHHAATELSNLRPLRPSAHNSMLSADLSPCSDSPPPCISTSFSTWTTTTSSSPSAVRRA